MLSLRRGAITAVTDRLEGLVRLEVDGRPCVAYPGITGPVALGDQVLVNVQAVELALGSGGFDVLYANLTRGLGLDPEAGAHVMKLPYTPLQLAVRHAEEGGTSLASLNGLPIVCCSLHSQVGPAAAEDGGRLGGQRQALHEPDDPEAARAPRRAPDRCGLCRGVHPGVVGRELRHAALKRRARLTL